VSHKGPAGFSTLHAAAVSGCTTVLPALVAAGVPLDGLLEATYQENQRHEVPRDTELRKFIHTHISAATSDKSALRELSWGRSPLAVAAWCAHLGWPQVWVGCLVCHAVRAG
jgi:hypothetical protein